MRTPTSSGGSTPPTAPPWLSFQYSLDAEPRHRHLDRRRRPRLHHPGAKNGNSAADRTYLAATIGGLGLANGTTVWMHWMDENASSADDGLAVDDLSVKPVFAIPEPSTCALVFGALALGLAAVRHRSRRSR